MGELVGRDVRIERGDGLPTGFSSGTVSHDCCHTLPGRSTDGWIADCNYLKEQALLTRVVPFFARHFDLVRMVVIGMDCEVGEGDLGFGV